MVRVRGLDVGKEELGLEPFVGSPLPTTARTGCSAPPIPWARSRPTPTTATTMSRPLVRRTISFDSPLTFVPFEPAPER